MADIRINALATTAASTASDDFIAVDGSANGTRKLSAYSPTFGGNLTVSGTGLSSVAGALNVTGALLAHQTAAVNLAYEGSSISQLVTYGADASTLGRLKVVLRKAGTSTDAVTAADFTSTAATLAGNLTVSGTDYNYVGGNKFFRGFTNYNVLYTGATELSINNQTDGANIASFKNNGNLLVGTAIDGGQKLQVNGTGYFASGISLATHATSAGGIGFGTETSLYRVGGGEVALDGISGNSPAFTLRLSGVSKSMLFNASGSTYLDTLTAGASIIFRSGNATTALTLDSSQNATFAGNVNAKKDLSIYGSNASSAGTITANSAAGGLYFYGQGTSTSMRFYTTDGAAASKLALTLDSSQNATFVSDVKSTGTNGYGFLHSAAAGSYRGLKLQTSGSDRWLFAANDSSESGSNAGSDLILFAYSDAGGFLRENLKITRSNGNATFAGAIAIGNTVNTVSPTSPNRTVTIVIGGTTYYLAAKTTND